MFERAQSLWRRLLRRGEAAEDRRVNVRFSTQVRISLAPAGDPSLTYTGDVRNVSRGGINLKVGHPFEEGDLISLVVPSKDNGKKSVLACVVHRQRAEPGRWTIGCAFSQEITEDDLEAFLSGGEATPVDQRRQPRFRCQRPAQVSLVGDPSASTFEATIANLSVTGIALIADRETLPGSLVNIVLETHEGQRRSILSCVVHSTRVSATEWHLGCNFISELEEAFVRQLAGSGQ